MPKLKCACPCGPIDLKKDCLCFPDWCDNCRAKREKKKLKPSEWIEIIEDRRDRALIDMKQSSKLAHNSYGAGADWGMWEMCNILIEDFLDYLDQQEGGQDE